MWKFLNVKPILHIQLAQKVLVKGLYLPALFCDVLPHQVDVVEKFRKGRLQYVRLPVVLGPLRVYDDVDALGDDGNVYVGIGHDRIAVVVDNPFRLPVYMNVTGSEGLYLQILVQCLVEELNGDLRSFDEVEGFHDDNVEQPVAHGSLRSDIGIVPIL